MIHSIRTRRPSRNRLRFESLEPRSLLSVAGSIDLNFGTQGSVAVPVVPTTVTAATPSYNTLSAVEADGSIVLAGSYVADGTGYFTIEKLKADGSPDSTFGHGGQATFAVGTSSTTVETDATALLVKPDGSIDVGGVLSGANSDSNQVVGVIQVTPTGSLDTNFGNLGTATLPIEAPDKEPFFSLSAMTLSSSGQIVIAGDAGYPDLNGIASEFYAARFDAKGTLDTTFGTSGIVEIPIATSYANETVSLDQATSVAIQSTGRILLSGNIQNSLPTGDSGNPPSEGVVIGLTTDGTLDTTFGGTSGTGVVFLPIYAPDPTQAGSLDLVGSSLQSDDKLVLVDINGQAGSTTGSLTRLNADGTIDTTFGQLGVVTVSSLISPDGVSVVPNGQILVTGIPNGIVILPQSTTDSLLVERFNSNGFLDTTFAPTSTTPGTATFSIPIPSGSSATTFGVTELTTSTVGPDGKLILTGLFTVPVNSTTPDAPYFLVIKANATNTPLSQEPPADYDGSGTTNIAAYIAQSGAFAYRPNNGSADVVVPFGISGIGQTIPAPGDYDGSGQTEIAAYLPSLGIYVYRPANGGPDVLVSFGLSGAGQSIPTPGDYFGTGVDDIAIYMPAFGAFAIRNPAGGPDEIIPFGFIGVGNTIPAPGDYFGTGQTDIAAYLPSIGSFAIRNPAGGPDEIIPFGIAGAGNSIPIPGDYDGSGKTELAVYFPKLGEFAYRPANGGPDVIVSFGAANDGSIPVPGDYDGSGKTEIAVFDPNYANFAYRPANGGADVIVAFGVPGQGSTLPPAAPVYSNIASASPSSVAVSASSVSSSVSSESVAVSVSKAPVPGGPMVKAANAKVRITSARPAQDDLSKSFV